MGNVTNWHPGLQWLRAMVFFPHVVGSMSLETTMRKLLINPLTSLDLYFPWESYIMSIDILEFLGKQNHTHLSPATSIQTYTCCIYEPRASHHTFLFLFLILSITGEYSGSCLRHILRIRFLYRQTYLCCNSVFKPGLKLKLTSKN
jgi:hypothetical protein